MKKRLAWLSAVGLACVVAGWVAGYLAAEEERVTDEVIAKAMHQSHSVMEKQQDRLHRLMDAFLTGDDESIRRISQELGQEMQSISVLFPPKKDREAAEWKAMTEIITQAGLLQQKAKAGKYAEAYDHFALLTKRCIACHQVRRNWGTFPEPHETDEKTPDASEQSSAENAKTPSDEAVKPSDADTTFLPADKR